jgi:hypothetical protein
MRNAPGFSMPRETPCRLTPLRKVESEHEALSLSSPAPTVRVPEAACDADSYLVFTATLVISSLSFFLSLSLSPSANDATRAPFPLLPENVCSLACNRGEGTGRDGTRRDERSRSRDRGETAGSRSSLARGPAFTALPLCRFAALHPLDRAAGLTQNADLQHSRLCGVAALHLWMGPQA